jgi:hypothetical protein
VTRGAEMAVACCGDDSRGRRKTGTVVEKKENGGDRGSPMWGKKAARYDGQ